MLSRLPQGLKAICGATSCRWCVRNLFQTVPRQSGRKSVSRSSRLKLICGVFLNRAFSFMTSLWKYFSLTYFEYNSTMSWLLMGCEYSVGEGSPSTDPVRFCLSKASHEGKLTLLSSDFFIMTFSLIFSLRVILS